MNSSPKQEQLQQLLNDQHASLQDRFPSDRQKSLLALTRAHDWHFLEAQPSELYETSYYTHGWQKALSLCFSASALPTSVSNIDNTLDTWADSLLQACDSLAKGERILEYCKAGFLRMQQGKDANFHVWVAGKKVPTEWRERADLRWWTGLLARLYDSEIQTLHEAKGQIQQQLEIFVEQWDEQIASVYKTTRTLDDYYRRLGVLSVKMMVCYDEYPPSVSIGGSTFAEYREVLGMLIAYALKYSDICKTLLAHHPSLSLKAYLARPHNDTLLIEALATALTMDRGTVRLALDAYTLDAENVSYHCSTADVPAPPLLRLGAQQRAWSLAGLFTEPLFFLKRELKRKYSYEYHTASHLREEIFRQDVYALFPDKRFVKSIGHVELRGAKGMPATDVDALIFDRKTGALALFELKSQDPFAYSQQERTRQRDYFYGARKQVLASTEWVKRNGVNTLLGRLDPKQVKRLKAQNVYIFVLGRYLAHFSDGPEFDTRAAWGTWPQVLRLIDATAFAADDANPMQSLYNKMVRDTPLAFSSSLFAQQEMMIGNTHIYMYPSFETYKNRF
ncbi:hypothetical protein KDA_53750 [Dictyobacter alpinus]|uniref:Uncharacterized protein n=1 Tax=Dictyobacter alpinus TaxID=2014873 RepID=A0A402BEN1_9CHLR|nr:hypothetical protein [Dictyobacter alpinus]GCE29891.1 hypothetical protein KDA_53750 [Dictyobacter alpinus]